MELTRIKHPECAEDEIFLGNVTGKHFQTLGWKTKRLGTTAMDQVDGDIIPKSWGVFPVFVKGWEYKAQHGEMHDE